MASLTKLATRNVLRNRRRSLITLFAIAGGLGLMIFSANIGFGSYQEMIRVGVSSLAGAVVIQGEGYQEEQDSEIVVEDGDAIAAAVAAEHPDAVVVQRMFLQGLLNSPVNSVGVGVTAIQPGQEAQVSDWNEKIVEGEYLDDDARGIVIGVAMADTLGVEVGDKLVMMTQGEDDVTSRLFRVRGLFRTGSAEMDGFIALIHIDAARELTGLPTASNQVSLHLPNIKDAEAIAASLGATYSGQALEVLTWQEAIPAINGLIEQDRKSNNIMMVFIGVIVAFGVLNTVLMSVMERIREFGVMLSLGMAPRYLSRLVMMEGLFLGTFAVAVGVAGAAAVTIPLSSSGMDMSSMLGGTETMDMAGIAISAVIYPAMDWGRIIGLCVGSVLLTALASAYPAWRAAQLKPVEAMNHV